MSSLPALGERARLVPPFGPKGKVYIRRLLLYNIPEELAGFTAQPNQTTPN
jgi:hypothetical protein